nr:MAG: wsv045-like protein [Hemigrapsus takanoi nimavirus]
MANDDILAPSNAFIRWKKALKVNNPLLTLSDAVSRDNEKNHVSVDFELNVYEANGEYHAAILLIAIDSFLSLLSASNSVQTRSKRINTETNPEGSKKGLFLLYVPAEVPVEYLLSNKLGQNGFPVGDSGPFRKWSTVNAVKISANESNADVLDRLETVDRDTIAAAIRATKKTHKYLDDAEMSRCLVLNNKNGKGEIYTMSSDRKANNIRSLEKGGAISEAAIAQKKKSRRKRDMSANPAVFVEKFVSPKKRKLMAAAMCEGASNGGGTSKKRKTTTSTISIASSSPFSSAASTSIVTTDINPSIIEPNTSRYTSSHKFTSVLMSPKEFTIAFNSSSSLRGAQRTKSLINKYISLLKANFSKAQKNNPEGILSRWRSPKGRCIVVVGDCKEGSPHGMETIGFSMTCKKSELFKSVCSLHTLLRQWMKVSSEIHSKITHVGENVPKMETVAEVLKTNLKKTARTMVRGVRPISSFKVPPCFACKVQDQNRSDDVSTSGGPSNPPPPSSVMGMTNERYVKIVEVFDFLMSGGVFVNAALNFMFFDSCIDECPPNIDVMVTASECMGHVTELNNFKEGLGGVLASTAPPQQPSPLLNNETPRQFLERKMTGPVDTFVNTSQDFRSRNRLPHDVTDTCRGDIAGTLNTRGAIAAFNDMAIKIRYSSSDVVIPLENKWWTDLHVRKLDSLYGMTDAFKSGPRCELESVSSGSYREHPHASVPSSAEAASTTASAIVVASVLTVPSLAKITSSKRFPDNIVFR